jgi:hypothetical protein
MYIAPRQVKFEDCDFYHSFNLANREVVGHWDLRDSWQAYLGHVNFAGQSVLEIGPASGFLSFQMERAGAQVTALEPPMSHLWDVVPSQGVDIAAWRKDFSIGIERVRNSFWYAHADVKSAVRMIELDPYKIPDSLGRFDVGVLAAVLLHCRRPFDLLESVATHTRKTVVVTEVYNASLGEQAACAFLPHRGVDSVDTWWHFTPQFFVSALGLLGFTEARVSFHQQPQPSVGGRIVELFTVVCERPDHA